MSLIRQLLLLLLGSLLLALAGSATVHVSVTRQVLQTQLNLKNNDNAAALAMVLSQQKGDIELIKLLMMAQFDTGFYENIRLIDGQGNVVFSRQTQPLPRHAPAWFTSFLPISAPPGVAQVSDGWRAIGSVQVSSQSAYVYDELWRGSVWSLLALAGLGGLSAALAIVIVQRIRRPLDRAVGQAHALVQGEFVSVPEPKVPELQRLTKAMNTMVSRLKLVFEAQARQVEVLRQQAHGDALTGLSNRKHFMAQLHALRTREDGTSDGGLVLVRVLNLAELNRTLGHDTTDRALLAISQALSTYVLRVSGCQVGRLNGCDFALCLPVRGLAQETAQALVHALHAVLPTLSAEIGVVAGAVEMRDEQTVAQLMSAADAALATAESRGPFQVALEYNAVTAAAMMGEGAWRQAIFNALAEDRLSLVSFPVLNSAHQALHLECPLRIQLDPQGSFVSAARWLPLALRARLTASIDERATALALKAIQQDAHPRCVNLSNASLADSAFAVHLRGILESAPHAANKLWMELPESAAIDHFDALQELVKQLKPLGVKLGLEHAGERLQRIERLFELNLDYVKLDTAVVTSTAGDTHRSLFVRSLVTLLHGLDIQVIAEGVAQAEDAQELWLLGVDGMTGPWASKARADLVRQ